jgi:hypothetical protein
VTTRKANHVSRDRKSWGPELRGMVVTVVKLNLENGVVEDHIPEFS